MYPIRSGRLLIYRFYDVANEINLRQAETIVARAYPVERLRLQRLRPRVVRFANPPLSVPLRPDALASNWLLPVQDVVVRLYAFGAVSVRLECPLPSNCPPERLEAFVRDALNADADALCRPVALRVLQEISPALYKPQWDCEEWADEDYLIIFVQDFATEAPVTAADLLREYDFARLLMGEVGPLSPQVRETLLQYVYTYTPEDLAVISWEAAFVYDTDGVMDVPDLLEFANAQLLELEFFDDHLDDVLEAAYDDVEALQNVWGLFRYARIRQTLSRLTMTLTEVTELSGRVVNALKITEDAFYAQVYNGASDVLGLGTWMTDVREKLDALRDVYSLLAEEAANARLTFLEATIVLLILFEIVLAILGVW